MAQCFKFSIHIFIYYYLRITWALDDRIYFDTNDERRWNTPPELIPEASKRANENSNAPQPRFLPFSASFTLNAGSSNAHSLSVSGSNEGISLSQSQSSSSSSFGKGRPGISASQSTSFSAGLSGISASDASAFNLNHPIFGGNSHATSNSLAFGQASSTAHGIVNNQAITGAHSSVGSSLSHVSSGASSSAGKHHDITSSVEPMALGAYHGQGYSGIPSSSNISPNYEVNVNNNGWKNNARPNFPKLSNDQSPLTSTSWTQYPKEQSTLQISGVSASSGSTSHSGGFSSSQSSVHSNTGSTGTPSSWTNNRVQTSGNAKSHAQAAAAAIEQHSNGKTQGSFSSSAISGSSKNNGQSQGTSISENQGSNSQGQVNSQTIGSSNFQGIANSGSVSFVRFPESDSDNVYNLPSDSVRSGSPVDGKNKQQKIGRKSQRRHPIDRLLTDFSETIGDIFDFK